MFCCCFLNKNFFLSSLVPSIFIIWIIDILSMLLFCWFYYFILFSNMCKSFRHNAHIWSSRLIFCNFPIVCMLTFLYVYNNFWRIYLCLFGLLLIANSFFQTNVWCCFVWIKFFINFAVHAHIIFLFTI